MKRLEAKQAVRAEVRVYQDDAVEYRVLASGRRLDDVLAAHDREVGRRYRLGLRLDSVRLVSVMTDGTEYVR